jgi:DivIVA domain-containing protein
MVSRIQNARFRTTRRGGYDEEEVDKFLDSLVKVLSDERRLDPVMVRDTAFHIVRLRPGYAQADVDALLEEVARYADGYR